MADTQMQDTAVDIGASLRAVPPLANGHSCGCSAFAERVDLLERQVTALQAVIDAAGGVFAAAGAALEVS